MIKTLTIKREGEQWYAVCTCELEKPEALPVSYEDVGIDLGVRHFAALSTGAFIESPRHYRTSEQKLKKLQEDVSRKQRGSHRRARAVQRMATAHRKIRNQRADFQHKQSRALVNRFQVIAFEDLKTANLVKRPKPKQDVETGHYLPNGASAKAGLNKSISDAGWSMFREMVKVKAAWAGRITLFVNPSKTSQMCSQCLKEGPHKDLDERIHTCIHCGVVLDRDTNAAINILNLGYKLLGGTRPTPATA
jgi:putative transposase